MIKALAHTLLLAGSLTLAACSQASDVADKAASDVVKVAQNAAPAPQDAMGGAMGAAMGGAMGGAMGAPAADMPTDLSLLSAGTYKSDDQHRYIAFEYVHQGYSKPILRWDDFDATINLNPDNLEASTLDVIIQTNSVSSGVPIWDERLQNDQYFNAAQFPTMQFKSTSLNMISKTKGTVTGDLTIKDVSVPVTLDVSLNKVGKHFRNGNDWFGISGTASVNRSAFGLSNGIPNTSDNVDIRVEVEFGKEE